MESLIQADIFFFVTTISIILLTAVIIVASVYVIKILRNMKDISEKVKKESDLIVDDINHLRDQAKREGLRLSYITRFFKGIFKKGKEKK